MPATDLLAFEDSAKGVRSALDARCRVIATPNVHTTRREEVADAHRVLDSLEQALPLKALVESLNRAF